jgi:hypothetical protein
MVVAGNSAPTFWRSSDENFTPEEWLPTRASTSPPAEASEQAVWLARSAMDALHGLLSLRPAVKGRAAAVFLASRAGQAKQADSFSGTSLPPV